MVNESSSSGIWNIKLSQGGTFNCTCVANNTVGTVKSALASVSVNGKQNSNLHVFKMFLSHEHLVPSICICGLTCLTSLHSGLDDFTYQET